MSPSVKSGSKAKRGPKPKRSPREGPPSTDTVFVANLSYSCTKEMLSEFFAAYEVESVHTAKKYLPKYVLRKIAAKGEEPPAPRSLGYAFVKLSSEEMQKKAIAELDGKELDGRTISVKVAIDAEQKPKDGEEVEGQKSDEAEAPAETETATSALAAEVEASA